MRLPVEVVAPTPRHLLNLIAQLRRDLDRVASTSTGRSFGRGLDVAGVLQVAGTLAVRGGLSLLRTNGRPMLRAYKVYENSTEETLEISDRDGGLIVAENSLGAGLARPHLEHPFQPVGPAGTALTCGPYGLERTTTSDTWEVLFVYGGKVQNAFLDLQVAVRSSDATTAGEVRVVRLDTGDQLPGFLQPGWTGVVPASTSTTVLDPATTQIVTPIGLGAGAKVRLGLQVRRTTGTGSITVSVPQSIGG